MALTLRSYDQIMKVRLRDETLYITDPETGDTITVPYTPRKKKHGISDIKRQNENKHLFTDEYTVVAYPTANNIFISHHQPSDEYRLFLILSLNEVIQIGTASSFDYARELRNRQSPSIIKHWLKSDRQVKVLNEDTSIEEGVKALPPEASKNPDAPASDNKLNEYRVKVPIIQYHREMFENFWDIKKLPAHREDEADDYEILYYFNGGLNTAHQDWDTHLQNMLAQGDKLTQIPNAYLYRPASEIMEEYKEKEEK